LAADPDPTRLCLKRVKAAVSGRFESARKPARPGKYGVSGNVLGVAWYRFRATFARRGGSYLALVLLIGLVGGVGMGAIAAARRTQSSFSTFLASTNPPDLTVTIYGANANNAGSNPSHSPRLTREIARLPYVRAVHVAVGALVLANVVAAVPARVAARTPTALMLRAERGGGSRLSRPRSSGMMEEGR
jgi:hypothetical protein